MPTQLFSGSKGTIRVGDIGLVMTDEVLLIQEPDGEWSVICDLGNEQVAALDPFKVELTLLDENDKMVSNITEIARQEDNDEKAREAFGE